MANLSVEEYISQQEQSIYDVLVKTQELIDKFYDLKNLKNQQVILVNQLRNRCTTLKQKINKIINDKAELEIILKEILALQDAIINEYNKIDYIYFTITVKGDINHVYPFWWNTDPNDYKVVEFYRYNNMNKELFDNVNNIPYTYTHIWHRGYDEKNNLDSWFKVRNHKEKNDACVGFPNKHFFSSYIENFTFEDMDYICKEYGGLYLRGGNLQYIVRTNDLNIKKQIQKLAEQPIQEKYIIETKNDYYYTRPLSLIESKSKDWLPNVYIHLDDDSRLARPYIVEFLNDYVDELTIRGSQFISHSADDLHVASQIILEKVSDNSLIYDSGEISSQVEFTIPILLDYETQYKAKIRYKGESLGWSEWSDYESVTTEIEPHVQKPSIIHPSNNSTVSENYRLNSSNIMSVESSSFVAINTRLIPDESLSDVQWQVATNTTFTNVVYTGTSTGLLHSIATNGFNDEIYYYIRCRQKGTTLPYSEWSDYHRFTLDKPWTVNTPSFISPTTNIYYGTHTNYQISNLSINNDPNNKVSFYRIVFEISHYSDFRSIVATEIMTTKAGDNIYSIPNSNFRTYTYGANYMRVFYRAIHTNGVVKNSGYRTITVYNRQWGVNTPYVLSPSYNETSVKFNDTIPVVGSVLSKSNDPSNKVYIDRAQWYIYTPIGSNYYNTYTDNTRTYNIPTSWIPLPLGRTALASIKVRYYCHDGNGRYVWSNWSSARTVYVNRELTYGRYLSAADSATIGLKANGGCIGIGYNSNGQRDVWDWNNVIQINSGQRNTVATRSDGTCYGIGEDDYGCVSGVRSFTNVARISVYRRHAVAVRRDGTCVASGLNHKGQCNVGGWRNIIQAECAYDATIGLVSNGTCVAVGKNKYGECNVGSWSNIVQIACSHQHTVGLRSNGTVVAVGNDDNGRLEVRSWTNIVQVDAGWYHTVGLKDDGTIVATRNLTKRYSFPTSIWNNLIEVVTGRFHVVGVKADGTCVGWLYHTDHGQCNVSSWDLF
jgi:hypothetical protein